jgi:Na+-translocating ferredoxin:NAD+ oxidoreductase subunit C
MMGKALNNLDVPVTKGTSGILIFTESEAHRVHEQNCIRCAKCLTICPMGLEPYLLALLADKKRFEDCEEERIMDCMECGSCLYICPSGRPLLDQIRVGKAGVGKMLRERSAS